jgi:hypothetical protein
MAGMYPAKHRDPHTVVSLLTYPPELENMHKQAEKCPFIDELQEEYKYDQHYQQALRNLSDLEKRLQRVFDYDTLHNDAYPYNTGNDESGAFRKEETWTSLHSAYTTLQARLCHGMPLPTQDGAPLISKMEMQQLAEFVDLEAALKNGDAGPRSLKAAQISAHGMLKELSHRLQHPDFLRFFYYSAHDTTLMNLLGALEASEKTWPPYSSNLVIELWQEDSEHILRMMYNGESVNVRDRWCDFERCPVGSFLDYVRPVLQIDLQEECTPPATYSFSAKTKIAARN